jgi:mono/diheme cytochrome c family protein
MDAFQLIRRAGSWGRQLVFAFCLLALSLSACSLAGDVTPPPGSNSSLSSGPAATGLPATSEGVGASPTSAAPSSATSAIFPAAMPSAQEGGLLYLQHCSPCHGDKGAGGGSMATQLPTQPPDFSDPATLRGLTPQLIFNKITQGNTQALMPPFASTLTDAQRWSLVSFLYTLSTPPDRLAAGRAVYTANCAHCHGPDGAGKGQDAAQQTQPLPSFADQSFMVTRSQQDFFKVVSGGDAAHPFTNLSETDRWAALDAVRAFAYDYVAPDQLTAERSGVVTGTVVNSTAGGAVPAGLSVILHGFEGQNLQGTYTTTTGADGAFQFAAVPFTPSRQFIVTTSYKDISYASQVGTFDLSHNSLNLSLPIYETTNDLTVLAVDQVHVFLEFNTPGQVTVGQLFIFSNHGDKTYVANAANPLSFTLPAGAASLNVQDAQLDKTFFHVGDVFTLLWSIPPGSGSSQVLFSFNLPYTDKLNYQQKMNYPVANVDVLIPDLGIQLAGSQVRSLGVQNFQGQALQDFSAGALPAGQTLDLQISGKPGTGVSSPAAAAQTSTTTPLVIGLGALALALLGIGFWIYRRPRRQAQAVQTKEDLLEALAELDDVFAAGQMPEADYHKEREQLKSELKKVWLSRPREES